jgi:hypothetical protein
MTASTIKLELASQDQSSQRLFVYTKTDGEFGPFPKRISRTEGDLALPR